MSLNTTKLAALAATVSVALAGVPAAAAAKATTTGKHTVTKTAYVYKKPQVGFQGTMFKGNTFKVERFSPSGKWAYGMGYGSFKRHGWISVDALTK